MPLPPLPDADWVDTKDTLHLFLQIIGKIRLETHPKLNHWWRVTLYPHVRGLTTGRIPYGTGGFEILYDRVDHEVTLSRHDGRQSGFSVPGLTVVEFYDALFSRLNAFDLDIQIKAEPYDTKSKTPFAKDTAPAPMMRRP